MDDRANTVKPEDCLHPKGTIYPLEDSEVHGDFYFYCLRCGKHLTLTEVREGEPIYDASKGLGRLLR